MPQIANFELALDGQFGIVSVKAEVTTKQQLKAVAAAMIDDYYANAKKQGHHPHGDTPEIILARSMPKVAAK